MRKIKWNITIKIITGFLLSKIVVFGFTETAALEIIHSGTDIMYTKDSGQNWDTKDPFAKEGNTFIDKKVYVNNALIKIKSNSTYVWGILGIDKFDMINIKNNGIIESKGESKNNDYCALVIGIRETGNIENYGNISGVHNGFNDNVIATNVIGINRSGNIENYGNISGVGIEVGQRRAITSGIQSCRDITNYGIVSGTGISSIEGIGYGLFSNPKITNYGIIEGNGILDSKIGNQSTGNGMYDIELVTNYGIISGTAVAKGSISTQNSGYGIEQSKDIINYGIISGVAFVEKEVNTGAEAYGTGTFSSEKITNYGTVYGWGESNGYAHGNGIISDGVVNYGVSYSRGGKNDTIGIYSRNKAINYGVSYGDDVAIMAKGGYENYGILVGGGKDKKELLENKGLIFRDLIIQNPNIQDTTRKYVDKSESTNYFGKRTEDLTSGYIIINARADVDKTTKDITNIQSLVLNNGELSGFDNTEEINTKNKYIFNGIENTLEVEGKENQLDNSIINAYKTAVLLRNDNVNLSLKGTIVNGGMDFSTSAIKVMGNNDTLILADGTIINGDITTAGNDNTLTITGGTIVNGKVVLAGNKSNLSLMDMSLINGDIESTGSNNILNLDGRGSENKHGMKILHNISGIKDINIDGEITFFETNGIDTNGDNKKVKIEAEEININAGGNLNLRIGTKKDADGRYTEHALFGNKNLTIHGDITNLPEGKNVIEETKNGSYNVGILNLITNRLGTDSIIAMDNITLDDNLWVKTDSILDSATILEKNEGIGKKGDIKIEGEKDIFEIEINAEKIDASNKKYIKLNNIYKSIYSSGDINFAALKGIISSSGAGEEYTSVKDETQLKALLSYLGDIYITSPYSYSSELSRKSVGMFRDIIANNNFNPDNNKWLIMGGLTHTNGEISDIYYGKNYYGFDNDSFETNVNMKLSGAYILGKYNYSNNINFGITAGGNKSSAELEKSKVKGNSSYIGIFAENHKENLIFKTGVGIQYSEYDANRKTIGEYSYNDKYSDVTYDIYVNGRYNHNIGKDLSLEPYSTLSYTYVNQNGADEGKQTLAMETDSRSFSYTVVKTGVDMKKEIKHSKGKSTLKAGINYTRILDGAAEKDITGRFKGGSDFEILVAKKKKDSIGLNAKYSVEFENGILVDIRGNYAIEDKSGKNRTKDEWTIGMSLGYRF